VPDDSPALAQCRYRLDPPLSEQKYEAAMRQKICQAASHTLVKLKVHHFTLPVLGVGCVGMSLPALLSHVNYWPFFYPHWSAYVAYGLVTLSALIARTHSERGGVLVAATALTISSTFLCWDPAMLNWIFSFNGWYGLVLDYIVPLATLSIAVPCLVVVLVRRLLRYVQSFLTEPLQ
jgi:hypothetical protein